MLEIKKIQLNKLELFINSDEFAQYQDKPISKIRAISYINNPNAKPDDAVLFIALENNILVGYATLWRDQLCVHNTTKSFGWMSGNWVHQNHRRKGITTKIFKEVYKAWNEELLYTNYSSDAFLFFDRTGLFKELKTLSGKRFYTRFTFAEILPLKKKIFKRISFLLKLIDGLGNSLLDFRLFFFKIKNNKIVVKKNENWNDTIDVFLTSNKTNELFNKKSKELSWALNYPWVKGSEEAKEESENYYFSVYSNSFSNDYYTLYNTKNELVAFVWFNCKDGHLKISYLYYLDKYADKLLDFLIHKIIVLKVKTVLIYDSYLENKLIKKLPYITKKTTTQKYFVTKKMLNSFEEIKDKKIKYGDGDVIFT